MSELVAADFPRDLPEKGVRQVLDTLQAGGATVYAWALVCKDDRGRIEVIDRMEKGAHTGSVAALIGALAGLPAGPLGSIVGAIAGALVGLSAEWVDQDSARRFLDKLSRQIDRDRQVLVADISPEDIKNFGDQVQRLGGHLA